MLLPHPEGTFRHVLYRIGSQALKEQISIGSGASSSSMSSAKSRPAKRQRTFGAPTEDDNPNAESGYRVPTDAISTRDVSPGGVPTLATLCARVFVKHMKHLSSDESVWEAIREWLKIIPDAMVPKLFAMLRSSCPTILSHGFIIAVGMIS
jgi:hypothetical protein